MKRRVAAVSLLLITGFLAAATLPGAETQTPEKPKAAAPAKAKTKKPRATAKPVEAKPAEVAKKAPAKKPSDAEVKQEFMRIVRDAKQVPTSRPAIPLLIRRQAGC